MDHILNLIILMVNEALILLQSKCDSGPIIPMTTINIPMDPSIYIIKFVLKNYRAQKPKLIPKIKCTILVEQLYCIYYNIKSKSAPKGVTIVCFHPNILLETYYIRFTAK
jgi:hypothetical protein